MMFSNSMCPFAMMATWMRASGSGSSRSESIRLIRQLLNHLPIGSVAPDTGRLGFREARLS